jgi:hypothetical protein
MYCNIIATLAESDATTITLGGSGRWISDRRTRRRKERWRLVEGIAAPLIENNCGVNYTNQSFCFIHIIISYSFYAIERALLPSIEVIG